MRSKEQANIDIRELYSNLAWEAQHAACQLTRKKVKKVIHNGLTK